MGTPGRGQTLLVVGATRYARDDAGDWWTLSALSKQLDQWFASFDEVVIACHEIPGPPLDTMRRLDHQRIRFVPLPEAGGSGLRAKLSVAWSALTWIVRLAGPLRRADAVHLRTPCNVTLIAIPMARLLARRRYAIYADNWEPLGVEALTFRLQRWMLKHWGGVVHVYAPAEAIAGTNLRMNASPSFTDAELDALEPLVAARLERLASDPVDERPLRICCIGRFSARKNQEAIVRAVALLWARGVTVEARLAGDGATREAMIALAAELGVADAIQFPGAIGPQEVTDTLAWADANLLVSTAEGYGKSLLEGFGVGCPAVCGPGMMQRAMIGDGERGRAAVPPDANRIADALVQLMDLDPQVSAQMVASCRAYVRQFTVEAFGRDIADIVHGVWHLPAPAPA